MTVRAGHILVTGASGYVAAHVLDTFLEAGYNVRGTVRSAESAQKVKRSHAKYSKQLELVIVPDITSPGAFDQAVADVDGVIHTQSPFRFDIEDNERDLLIPAIKGTLGILESIQNHAPAVGRVVITSSFAAMLDVPKGIRPGYTYSELDWNPATYEEGKSGDGGFAYCASKALAESAAWNFVQQRKPQFSLTTICPPVVYGPIRHHVDSLSNLNESSAFFYSLMNGSRTEVPPTGFGAALVDVRDVGMVHRLAYESVIAAGQRYLPCGDSFSFQKICDILRANRPELATRVPKGDVGAEIPMYAVNREKCTRDLGLVFKRLEEIVTDTADDFLELESKLKTK